MGLDAHHVALLAQRGYQLVAEDEHRQEYARSFGPATLTIVVSANCAPFADGRVDIRFAEEILNKSVYRSHAVKLTPYGLSQTEREFAPRALEFIRTAKRDVARL